MKVRTRKDGRRYIDVDFQGIRTKVSILRGVSKAEERAILNQVKARISLLRTQADRFDDWDDEEKKIWIRTGEEPKIVSVDKLTFEEIIELFKKEKETSGKSLSYIQSIDHMNKRPLAFFGKKCRIDRISVLDAQSLVDHLAKSKITNGKNRGKILSNATIKKILHQLTSIFRFAKTKLSQGCDPDVFSMVSMPVEKCNILDELTPYQSFDARCSSLEIKNIDPNTEGAFHKIIYTVPELREHLAFLKQNLWDDGDLESRRLYAAVLFCAYTGCRRGEIVRVKKSDIDFENKKAVIRIKKGRKDKAIKLHQVNIMDDIIPILKGLVAQTSKSQDSLFVCSDGFEGLGVNDDAFEIKERDSLHKRLRKALHGSKWQHVSGWHIYRHSFASMLFTSGLTGLEVMKIVGWDTSEMAAHYSHLTEQATREKLTAILPALGGS